MEIPNYEKYDDNYLYVLVEDYIEEKEESIKRQLLKSRELDIVSAKDASSIKWTFWLIM